MEPQAVNLYKIEYCPAIILDERLSGHDLYHAPPDDMYHNWHYRIS